MAQSTSDAPQPDHTAEPDYAGEVKTAFANSPEPAPAAGPDHETAVVHMMNAVEQIASILSHASAAVPALMGMGAQIAALFGHVKNARDALNPPSDPPAA